MDSELTEIYTRKYCENCKKETPHLGLTKLDDNDMAFTEFACQQCGTFNT